MKTYTKKEIAFILQYSQRTIEEDLKHLKIKPLEQVDYGTNLYSDRDFEVVKQLRDHCKNGKTRETFLINTPVELVNSQPHESGFSLPRASGETDKMREIIALAKRADPLAELEILQRITNNNWLMTTSKLAAIIGVRSSTLTNNNPYNYCGFVCSIHKRSGNSFLWRINQEES